MNVHDAMVVVDAVVIDRCSFLFNSKFNKSLLRPHGTIVVNVNVVVVVSITANTHDLSEQL